MCSGQRSRTPSASHDNSEDGVCGKGLGLMPADEGELPGNPGRPIATRTVRAAPARKALPRFAQLVCAYQSAPSGDSLVRTLKRS
jgi:hypothetical protein